MSFLFSLQVFCTFFYNRESVKCKKRRKKEKVKYEHSEVMLKSENINESLGRHRNPTVYCSLTKESAGTKNKMASTW